jgi:glycosyltransferase involved in cell wall biosynthesis
MRALGIAHVLSSFGMGGQERVALDLAARQRARGHRVIAISLAPLPDGPIADSFHAAQVRTETIPKGSGVDATLPVRLANCLTAEHIDVVHTHNPHALIYGAPAANLARAAAVHSKHGINPDSARRLLLRRVASTLVDAYVAVTPSLERIAREQRECDPGLLHVIPNGIDVQRFTPNREARRAVRAELGIPEGAWVAGTVGRLAPEKNQTLFVRAMAPLLDERRHLVVVGDGPERAALDESIAATWRPQLCHATGGRNDVERLLAAFDAFVLTSKTEGLPLVLLEAMAMGLPVVSTAVGGIPDLIEDGVTGYLVPPGDERELMRRLVWLATHPSAGLRVGEAARAVALERYSLERMADGYEALYQKVTAARVRSADARVRGGVREPEVVGASGAVRG